MVYRRKRSCVDRYFCRTTKERHQERMRIYRCVKTLMITQRWGTNGDWYRDNGINIDGHNGYDFKCYRGEPVAHCAEWSGIAKTEIDNRGGIGVRVINKEIGFSVLYWHLLKVNPAIYDGKEVKFGDLIGYGDSTGFSTGDHVHFGLKQVNSRGNTINNNNGYYGAIDPTPYFENMWVGDVLSQKLTLMQKLLELLLRLRAIIRRS